MTMVATLEILQACFEVILSEVATLIATLTKFAHLCFLGFGIVATITRIFSYLCF